MNMSDPAGMRYCATSPIDTEASRASAPCSSFVRLCTCRMRLSYRAARLTIAEGRLTLTLAENPDVRTKLLHRPKTATRARAIMPRFLQGVGLVCARRTDGAAARTVRLVRHT